MKILSHRGYWKTAAEKNTETAFVRSFELGFGTETDLRDLDRAIVISHDPPAHGAMAAEAMFELHQRIGPGLPLALNIKADGLQAVTVELLQRFEVRDAFVFDMSVPDTLRWLDTPVPVFTRHSDVEPDPPLYDRSAGVWLDAFHGDWWSVDTVRAHLDAGKRVCIVSPDLHRREHRGVWDRLVGTDVCPHQNLMLCTDFPEEAKGVFDHGH